MRKTRTPGEARAYQSWSGMRRRCLNPRDNGYPDYGGRGITICERWAKFANFLADMGERPKAMSIGRIDNDGNYEPSNCRWETISQQAINRRDNRPLTLNGKTQCLCEWARELGFVAHTMTKRMGRGFTFEQALAMGNPKPIYVPARAAGPRYWRVEGKTNCPECGVALGVLGSGRIVRHTRGSASIERIGDTGIRNPSALVCAGSGRAVLSGAPQDG